MTKRISILICDDDRSFQSTAKELLKGKYEVRSALNIPEAKVILKNNSIDILLLDVQIQSDDDGLKIIPNIRELSPETEIITVSGLSDFRIVREAMRLGALDFIQKDCERDEFLFVIDRVISLRDLSRKQKQVVFETKTRHLKRNQLIGKSEPILSLNRIIEKAKKSRANVVITGETGTGKEVVARSLRATLPDGALEPFVSIDSATIQSTMAESLLFGHEKGAFTGAEKTTRGLFEEADGGVVYFDEIVNMPLDIQSKLLRVIQEKEVTRIGSSKPLELDFRVIAASNKPLEELIEQNKFKEDLYQRLNVIPIHVPPLRERASDIPLLLNHFGKIHKRENESLEFTPEVIELLTHYRWPGNIRELSNLVAYLAVMIEGPIVQVSDLPTKVRPVHQIKPGPLEKLGLESDGTFYERVKRFEKVLLESEIEKLSGNLSKVSTHLSMDRSHLYAKIKDLGIQVREKQKN